MECKARMFTQPFLNFLSMMRRNIVQDNVNRGHSLGNALFQMLKKADEFSLSLPI
jgi:hypothetical protein